MVNHPKRSKRTLTIQARPFETASGVKYVMVTSNGTLPQDGKLHDTPESVYRDCDVMFDNPVWCGRLIKDGYRIINRRGHEYGEK